MTNKQARKALKVIETINANPGMTNTQVAREVGCTNQYVTYMRRKMIQAQPEPVYDEAAEITGAVDFNDAPTQEELDVVLEAASVLDQTKLDSMLTERGIRYGTFLKRAIIAQRLKAVMADTPNWIAINDDMAESLEMIAHKISRILGGDPAYADSWVDIAGYAQLVADRLNGKER